MAEEIDALKAELAAAKEATPGHTDGEKRMHALVTQAYVAQQDDLERLERSPAHQLTTVKAAELGKPASKLPEFAIVTCSECTSMRMHLRCLGKTVKGKARKAADDAIRQGSAWLCVCCARKQSRRPATV